ncbi:MAG: hemerythrin domain-containing protein [Pseudomonadota bacterium]
MPNRVQWDPRFSVGNEIIDAQHKHFLDQCNGLADCLDAGGDACDQKFDQLFTALMAGARDHFAAEEARLAGHGYPDLEAHRNEQEEFAFLANEIVTTDNFDREELQTFLALWWVGHIMGAARGYRDYLA